MTSEAVHNCIVTSDKYGHPFSNLSSDLADLVVSISSSAIYCRKTRLFVEGQKPRGAFILRTGRAKLTICSTLGRTIIARFADPGDVLGLNAAVSGHPYGAAADMMATGRLISYHSIPCCN